MSLCRTLVVRCVASIGLTLTVVGAQALELRGFRGVDWGQGAARLGTTVAQDNDGDVACYRRERENMLFGDSTLQDVRYCFHDDRLVMVTLDAAVAPETLTAEFQRTYGPPDARTGRAAAWGQVNTGTRATLVPQGSTAARLTLSVETIDPAVAARIDKLVGSAPAARVSSGF